MPDSDFPPRPRESAMNERPKRRQGTCSAESRDCWKRGRYDRTSRPCTRSRMWPRPGRTSRGTCQGFMGCRPVGRERQDAGHTARSCFVWPSVRQRVTYLLAEVTKMKADIGVSEVEKQAAG